MATAAVGDVHGNREALSDLLSRLRPALDDDDTVVFLGEYFRLPTVVQDRASPVENELEKECLVGSDRP